MKKGLKRLLIAASVPLVGALASCSYQEVTPSQNNSDSYFSSTESQIQSPKKVPDAPQYDMKALYCTGYATRAASDRFGKSFVFANAWDMSYHNKVVVQLEKDKDKLKQALDDGTIEPGMLVMMYNDHSWYNFHNRINGKWFSCRNNKGKKTRCKDSKGNPRKYTHALVYAGKDSERGHMFYSQYDEDINTFSFEGIKFYLSPVEVLDEPDFMKRRKKNKESWEHVVSRGENYSSIANQYNLNVMDVMKMNGCNSFKDKCSSLSIGQKIVVKKRPEKKLSNHKVSSGETYWNLAAKYGLNPMELIYLNGCKSLNDKCSNLKVGQKIKVLQ